jgi:hypothetical protein
MAHQEGPLVAPLSLGGGELTRNPKITTKVKNGKKHNFRANIL